MKRIKTIQSIIMVVMVLLLLVGCSSKTSTPQKTEEELKAEIRHLYQQTFISYTNIFGIKFIMA